MTTIVHIMPKLRGPLVVALLYDGLCTFEFGLVTEVFGLSRPEMGADWYRFASYPIEPGPLTALGGLRILCEENDSLMDEADIIVIPGWKGPDVPVPESLSARLRTAHARGARLVSICSGAFVLAATGLLDGATATTHWRYAAALSKMYPRITVDADSLYRGANRVFTSAGSAAGIDLLIDMVRQDYGAVAANSVARRIVMPAHRTGGQAQFLDRPVSLRSGHEIGPLLEHVRSTLADNWSVSRMAKHSLMSERTFVRRFKDACGLSPGEWLIAERITRAKELLCQQKLSIEEIAAAVGLGGPHGLRHHFRLRVGISPSAFRRQFALD
jgi:AraC family transcriptional activator FtrA